MNTETEEEHRQAKKEAMERTSILANERTYAAWIRTGLTAFASTLGFVAFMANRMEPIPFFLTIILLALCSATFFVMGAWRYHHVGTRMISIKLTGAPIWLLMILSAALVVVSLTLVLGILQIF